MTTAPTLAPAVPAVADALAALLPARRLGDWPWTIAPAQHAMRHGAPCARLTDGVRALLVVEVDETRLEVFVEHPDVYPYRVDIVADASNPGAAAHIAGRLLRWVLPELDRDISTASAQPGSGFHPVHRHRALDVTELGYTLTDSGAHPEAVSGYCGPGLVWATERGGIWGVRAVHDTLVANYTGPLGGLYGVLPLVLPPADGHVPADTGSVFTRYLTDRFPQLSPITAHEVSLTGYQEPDGYVALPNHDVPTDRADEQTPVVAEFSHLGADLLLTAVPHLI